MVSLDSIDSVDSTLFRFSWDCGDTSWHSKTYGGGSGVGSEDGRDDGAERGGEDSHSHKSGDAGGGSEDGLSGGGYSGGYGYSSSSKRKAVAAPKCTATEVKGWCYIRYAEDCAVVEKIRRDEVEGEAKTGDRWKRRDRMHQN